MNAPARAKPDLALSEPAPGLVAEDLSVTYRSGTTAIHNVSFAIPKGSITALVGVNGSGKSTLFKAIMGFAPSQYGTISILGMTREEALRQNLVAYVPQSEDVDWTFPVLVEDVVMMGRYGRMNWLRQTRPQDREKVAEALERVGMTEFRRRQIGELSGGQKKRVFLARALAQEGQLILLDEPFTGVDVTTEQQIVELLGDLRAEGRVMLVSTHDLGSVPEYCDRAILINRTILASGPTEKVFTRKNLELTFGGALRHIELAGAALHKDETEDHRRLTMLSDHEKPFVTYRDDDDAESDGAAPVEGGPR